MGSNSLLTEEERFSRLGRIIGNGTDLVRFLIAPVSDTETIIEQLDFTEDESDALTSLVLEKLDWHEIYLTTDQEPIAIDWLRRLDVILNRRDDETLKNLITRSF